MKLAILAMCCSGHDEFGCHVRVLGLVAHWGAPSSQSKVTSNTGPSSACSARHLRMRASTPL